ncbi:hypothetical protein E2C01_074810 [Portunus trituberculatus]|uniref:Uncharacterized protein n=1 Tax=Portunus trituberculatus TaxID=210409 RepID=A0A5B7IE42_PORTR|nr:hypothetical protein [Portunus trituberculatus]
MELKVFVLCLAAAAGVAAGKEVDKRRSKVSKVRFVPYFKNRVQGTGEVVQFYRAIYPPDYSDLSQMTQEEVQRLASSGEGPEENPFLIMEDEDENPYFGRSRECRETQLTQHDLARRCARADIFLLGWRRSTIYTLWNLLVYFQPIVMFFVTAWLVFVGFNLLVQVTQWLVDFTSKFRVSDKIAMNAIKTCVTDLAPGTGEEDAPSLRWNPEQLEMLRRLRLKVYYDYIVRKEGGNFIDGMDPNLSAQSS